MRVVSLALVLKARAEVGVGYRVRRFIAALRRGRFSGCGGRCREDPAMNRLAKSGDKSPQSREEAFFRIDDLAGGWRA